MPRYPEYQIHDLDTYGYGRVIQTIDGKFYDGWGNSVIFTLFGKEVSINVEGVGEDSTDGGNVNNTNNTNNTDLFKELQDQIDNLKNQLNVQNTTIGNQNTVPTGTIIMWGGSEAGIPPGWNLCDGSTLYAKSAKLRDQLINQGNPFGEYLGNPLLPDLRERFVVGAGKGNNNGENNSSVVGNAYIVGDKGGLINNMLTLKNIPEHEHRYSVIMPDYGIQNAVDDEDFGDDDYDGLTRDFSTRIYTRITSKDPYGTDITDGECGIYTAGPNPVKDGPGFTKKNVSGTFEFHPDDPKPIENRPPYFALCYIIKL